jgi:imidazolonepropionase-like amidohydrolase
LNDAHRLLAITGATLIDGRGGPPLRGATVLVRGASIAAAGGIAAVRVPDGAEILDASGLFLVPGLIDAHLHLGGTRSPDPMREVWVSPGVHLARATEDMRRLLGAGFTTVRECGYSNALALREAVAEGTLPGPRILAAGRFIEPTGGADDRAFMPLEWAAALGGPRIADGPAAVREAVRAQLREGSDFIKTCATGAAMVHARSDINLLEWTDDELSALIDEAHRRGVRVAVHAHAAEGIKQAVRLGADSIEHGTFLDAEAARMMATTGTFLVPTFFQLHQLAARGAEFGAPGYVLEKAGRLEAARVDTFRHALEQGTRIAMGTDCTGTPVGPHGENARELDYMVQAGMPAMHAVVAMTAGGAALLGLSQEIGTVEAGKRADLVLIGGDPLARPEAMQDVRIVVQGGRIVARDGVVGRHPSR